MKKKCIHGNKLPWKGVNTAQICACSNPYISKLHSKAKSQVREAAQRARGLALPSLMIPETHRRIRMWCQTSVTPALLDEMGGRHRITRKSVGWVASIQSTAPEEGKPHRGGRIEPLPKLLSDLYTCAWHVHLHANTHAHTHTQ